MPKGIVVAPQGAISWRKTFFVLLDMTKKNIQFHIKVDDYFRTLATILDLLRQDIESKGYRRKDIELLKRVKEDLIYLQRHYKIVKKHKNKRSAVSN